MDNIDSSAIKRDPSDREAKPLPPGTKAHDFTLRTAPDKTVSLSDYRGRNVILSFYPADFSPVCTGQLSLYNELLPEFERYNATVLGISVDGIWSHMAFEKSRNLHFPLLSDFQPRGEVSRKFGVFREDDGMDDRALFVIDGDGVIRWSYVSPLNVNPGAEGILKALEDMKAKEGRVAATV
jgi:peroxiredoxin (alkyl hydroperoxide reductase subunit C)